MSSIQIILPAVFGYLIGSIPFGIILSRAMGLGDLRAIGSGNIGATNVLRTGNKKAAALTLLLDALKGTVPVLICAAFFGEVGAAFAGLGAFLGHCFPVWLKFKGGKGVATFMGVLLGLNLPAFFVFCTIWLGVAALTKYSSAAALGASLIAALTVFVTAPLAVGVIAALMAAFLAWRHRENIARLRAGTESRISLGSKR